MGGQHRMVDVVARQVHCLPTFHDLAVGGDEHEVVDGGLPEGNAVAEHPEVVGPQRVTGADVAVADLAPPEGGEHPVADGALPFADRLELPIARRLGRGCVVAEGRVAVERERHRAASSAGGGPSVPAGNRAVSTRSGSRTTLEGMKLLLVEDDEKLAATLRRGLEAEGFAVEVAHDGLDGWWMASEFSYDLVVLDLMLPGRNGYRICADLRAAGDWTPVLMLTAKDGDLDEAEGLETGADDYLVKPVRFPVLVARIRALLRRAPLGRRRRPPSAT